MVPFAACHSVVLAPLCGITMPQAALDPAPSACLWDSLALSCLAPQPRAREMAPFHHFHGGLACRQTYEAPMFDEVGPGGRRAERTGCFSQ